MTESQRQQENNFRTTEKAQIAAIEKMRKDGFVRARIDGEIVALDEGLKALAKTNDEITPDSS